MTDTRYGPHLSEFSRHGADQQSGVNVKFDYVLTFSDKAYRSIIYFHPHSVTSNVTDLYQEKITLDRQKMCWKKKLAYNRSTKTAL